MGYDFEKVGKQTVLDTLIKNIKGKSDVLQTSNLRKDLKLQTLKDVEKLAKDAYKILSEL
jgi:hypothetical protein